VRVLPVRTPPGLGHHVQLHQRDLVPNKPHLIWAMVQMWLTNATDSSIPRMFGGDAFSRQAICIQLARVDQRVVVCRYDECGGQAGVRFRRDRRSAPVVSFAAQNPHPERAVSCIDGLVAARHFERRIRRTLHAQRQDLRAHVCRAN
jgi:hypothetical protein